MGIPVNKIDTTVSNESTDIGWFDKMELLYLNVFPDIRITYDYIMREVIK